MIVPITIFLPSIFIIHDYIHWTLPLQEISLATDDLCNLECKLDAEESGFTCKQMSTDKYACVGPRKMVFSDLPVQYSTTIPGYYGEIIYFPLDIQDVNWGDISYVKLVDDSTQGIEITFDNSAGTYPNDFEYTTVLEKGQTFVSTCISDWKSVHVWRYNGIFEFSGESYVEFWGGSC